MKVEVVYESGQTYTEYISAGTARISQSEKHVIFSSKIVVLESRQENLRLPTTMLSDLPTRCCLPTQQGM